MILRRQGGALFFPDFVRLLLLANFLTRALGCTQEDIKEIDAECSYHVRYVGYRG
jgi:hypothetical protein